MGATLDLIGLNQGCTDTGAPIMVPVGQETLGRIMNVIGEPVDERGPINSAAKVRNEENKTILFLFIFLPTRCV